MRIQNGDLLKFKSQIMELLQQQDPRSVEEKVARLLYEQTRRELGRSRDRIQELEMEVTTLKKKCAEDTHVTEKLMNLQAMRSEVSELVAEMQPCQDLQRELHETKHQLQIARNEVSA